MQTWPDETTNGATSRPVSALRMRRDEAVRPATPIEQLGTVRIARRVLRTVIEQAVLHVRGVARMATMRNGLPQRLGRPLPQHGVSLTLRDNTVSIDLYIIVAPGNSMVDVGVEVQAAVGAAVEHILGMEVSEINVYIQDVA